MTFGLVYAFSEKFVLPLSHDEVVHGKGSLIGKMPGDEWQSFANLRAYFGFMWTHPGQEAVVHGRRDRAGPRMEPRRRARLGPARRSAPRRHAATGARSQPRVSRNWRPARCTIASPSGFRWLIVDDRDQSVFAWLRFGEPDDPPALVVSNFTPVPRVNYRIGVPRGGCVAGGHQHRRRNLWRGQSGQWRCGTRRGHRRARRARLRAADHSAFGNPGAGRFLTSGRET